MHASPPDAVHVDENRTHNECAKSRERSSFFITKQSDLVPVGLTFTRRLGPQVLTNALSAGCRTVRRSVFFTPAQRRDYKVNEHTADFAHSATKIACALNETRVPGDRKPAPLVVLQARPPDNLFLKQPR